MVSLEEFVERLCLLGADRGPRGFPRRFRDREILMKSITMGLDSGRTYTELEINEVLHVWSRDVTPAIEIDHVTLRRHLVDYGHLERTADGSSYRVGFPPRPLAFDLEVDDLDLRATVAAYRAHAERQRAERGRGRGPGGGQGQGKGKGEGKGKGKSSTRSDGSRAVDSECHTEESSR